MEIQQQIALHLITKLLIFNHKLVANLFIYRELDIKILKCKSRIIK